MKNLFTFFVLFFSFIDISFAHTNNYNTEKFEYICPVPGSKYILPGNNIIIREGEQYSNINLNDTTLIEVFGSISGKHSGSLYLTDDQKTLIFLPQVSFAKGEIVTANLRSGLKTISNQDVDSLSFQFKIAVDSLESSQQKNNYSTKNNFTKETSKNLENDFPEFKVENLNNPAPGNIFIGLNLGSFTYLSILNNNGIPIFYKKFLGRANNFGIQVNNLLTYFNRNAGKYYTMDRSYTIVDSFSTGNGYSVNGHGAQVLPNKHVFFISYDPQPINMAAIVAGGDSNATVRGSIIQEVDENGVVVWQWRAWDNYEITDIDTSFNLTLPSIDFGHINALYVVDDNSILVSARSLNEITKIDRNTGKIIWRFGGKKNQFAINDPIQFHLQHGIKGLENGNIMFYDNGLSFVREYSRAVEYSIDTLNNTAQPVWQFIHDPQIWGKIMGSVQRLPNGNTFIGWGNIGASQLLATEVHQDGSVAMDFSVVTTNAHFSYCAFKYPWKTTLFTTNVDTLNFSDINVGDSLIKSVTINNNSNKELSITSFYNSNGSFSAIDSLPLIIPANGNVEINVKFKPSSDNEIFDSLYIRSEKTDEMIAQVLFLSGNKKITAVKEDAVKISNYNLSQNYPNPFNPSTKIKYTIPNVGTSLMKFVQLKVYDVLGSEIATLVNKRQSPGNYEVEFDANGLSSGIYFYKLISGSFSSTKKMILLR